MKDRKSSPKTALPRIYFIDGEIASGKYPNTRTLAENYQTGTAAISRDIEYMRDMMNAPIEYDFTKKGYYYTEKTFRLPAAFGSAEDMLALGMAKTLLTLYKNTPIYNAAKELMESITAPLGKADNPRWHEDRIVVPPIPAVQFSSEVWNKVCEGIQKNCALSFDYRPDWQSGYTRRLVYPYQLLFDNGAWYLYAYLKKVQADRRSAGMRMYSLSRIKNISVEKERFTFPASADFRVRTDGSYLGA
jgi:predicted DNA-binding transcriptional regulator YafY